MRNRSWVIWISPGNSLGNSKSSEDLRVFGDHRPFWLRYKVADGNRTTAPGEFLNSLKQSNDLTAFAAASGFNRWQHGNVCTRRIPEEPKRHVTQSREVAKVVKLQQTQKYDTASPPKSKSHLRLSSCRSFDLNPEASILISELSHHATLKRSISKGRREVNLSPDGPSPLRTSSVNP